MGGDARRRPPPQELSLGTYWIEGAPQAGRPGSAGYRLVIEGCGLRGLSRLERLMVVIFERARAACAGPARAVRQSARLHVHYALAVLRSVSVIYFLLL
jgi:hypothetical protein